MTDARASWHKEGQCPTGATRGSRDSRGKDGERSHGVDCGEGHKRDREGDRGGGRGESRGEEDSGRTPLSPLVAMVILAI